MMSSASKVQLPFREWPADDRQRWEAVFKSGDLFDEATRGAHLAPSTREALRASYARYLRFVADHHNALLERPPEVRLNRELVAEYVSLLRRTNQESSVVRLAAVICCSGRTGRHYYCPTLISADAFSLIRTFEP